VFADAERERLGHEVAGLLTVMAMAGVVMPAMAGPFDRGNALRVAGGECPTVGYEVDAPRPRSMTRAASRPD